MNTYDPGQLRADFQTTTWIIESQAQGLSHADSLRQLPFRGNCFNWVIGHILISRQTALGLLGGQATWLDPSVEGLYRRGSDPLTDENRAVPLERLMTAVRESQERLAAALTRLSAADLAVIVDDERQRSLGERIAGLHWHETYHCGQLEILRQLAGTDDQIL